MKELIGGRSPYQNQRRSRHVRQGNHEVELLLSEPRILAGREHVLKFVNHENADVEDVKRIDNSGKKSTLTRVFIFFRQVRIEDRIEFGQDGSI